MYNAGEAAFVTNVGTLEPITANSYSTSSLPSNPLLTRSGHPMDVLDRRQTPHFEGARVADLYMTLEPNSQTSMLITAGGSNQFMNGGPTKQFTVTSSGAISSPASATPTECPEHGQLQNQRQRPAPTGTRAYHATAMRTSSKKAIARSSAASRQQAIISEAIQRRPSWCRLPEHLG